MLSYLASALPTGASPEARLLALQCALRADNHGQARMPAGVLRGMRLAHEPELWNELERYRWLRLAPKSTGCVRGGALTAQLLDPLTQAPGRPDRLRIADWALRVTSSPLLRGLPTNTRLTALALASHHSPGHARTSVEADRLRRVCGLDSSGLGTLLEQLVAAGTIAAWTCDPATDEVHWTTSQPATRPPVGASPHQHSSVRGICHREENLGSTAWVRLNHAP